MHRGCCLLRGQRAAAAQKRSGVARPEEIPQGATFAIALQLPIRNAKFGVRGSYLSSRLSTEQAELLLHRRLPNGCPGPADALQATFKPWHAATDNASSVWRSPGSSWPCKHRLRYPNLGQIQHAFAKRKP